MEEEERISNPVIYIIVGFLLLMLFVIIFILFENNSNNFEQEISDSEKENSFTPPSLCSNYCPYGSQCGFNECGLPCGEDGGKCEEGYFCLNYRCIKEKINLEGDNKEDKNKEEECNDTCTSLGYLCGDYLICGESVSCGKCEEGYNCASNGTCIKIPLNCIDSCESLSYECGNQNVCGILTNCNVCQEGYECNSNGKCVCVSESNIEFCLRLNKTCGKNTELDNCGELRTVSCGVCDDNNVCTTDSCSSDNKCVYAPISCDDSNECTTDICNPSTGCSHTSLTGIPCRDDNNPCTTDICNNGLCTHIPISDCCVSNSQCGGGSFCPKDYCNLSDNKCYKLYPNPPCQNNDNCCPLGCNLGNDNDCTTCTSDSHCNDNNVCTTNKCVGGICTYPVITQCINGDGCCPTGCNSNNDNNCNSVCGNGIKEAGEECDNTQLGGATCTSVLGSGYTAGSLTCTLNCKYNTSNCCSPESNTQFCTRLIRQCGNITALDNCGNYRTVSSCGTCQSGYTCSNGLCIKNCVPNCVGKECGSDGCSGLCGTCKNSYGTTNCLSSGICQPSCISGYGDCDGNRVNGCETSLTTIYNCGSCGNTCQSGQTCLNGQCSGVNPPVPPAGNTYYVSTTGSDSSGTGSSSNPWKSLYKACQQVTTSGSVIHVNSGTYTETQQCLLSNGVSIEGEGRTKTTIIMRQSTSDASIKIETLGHYGNTNYGNQHVSGIKFDGQLTANAGIYVIGRSNVEIYNCEFIDFYTRAVKFEGQPGWEFTKKNIYNQKSSGDYTKMADAWATGNKFYNNIITSCSRKVSPGILTHALDIGAQDGMLIYGNTISATGRPYGQNGYCLGFASNDGFNKNVKIYNNYLENAPLGDSEYEFAIEWWWDLGGTEIYNNRILGAVDIVHALDAIGKGYSVNIYDNDIGYESTPVRQDRGILLEGRIEYLNIYRNKIHHVGRAIYIPREESGGYTGVDRLFQVRIYNNLMVNLGQTGSTWQTWGIHWSDYVDQEETQYLYIQHNVIEAIDSLKDTTYGIMLPSVQKMSNIYIENNILLNWDHGAIYGRGTKTKAQNIFIRNNLMYGNSNNNDPVYESGFPTSGITYSGTVKANPLFVSSSNYKLSSSSSPAYHKGIYVGISNDYELKKWNNPPSIGAYEYSV